MKIRSLLWSFVLTIWAVPSLANNGMVTSTFSAVQEMNVDCVGEVLIVNIDVTVKGHLFSSPSGNVIALENWSVYAMATGTSGKRWFAKKNHPHTSFLDLKNRDLQTITQTIHLKPLDGGPQIILNQNYQVRFDENGELISASLKFATGESFRCVGAKN